MSLLSLILCAGALALLLAAAWVRLAPSDPARWHVDPADVTARGARNSWLVADAPGADAPALHVALSPAAAGTRIGAVILATPRTYRLAGDDAFATYVTRSALWGFPDYASVRVIPDGQGAAISIFSRARFGDGDLGVNRARVTGWLRDLQASTPAIRS